MLRFFLSCEYNNKDEDNSPKTQNNKIYRASSLKFIQIIIIFWSSIFRWDIQLCTIFKESGVLFHCYYSQFNSGPEWASDKVLSMGQIELFDIYTECIQMTQAKLNF